MKCGFLPIMKADGRDVKAAARFSLLRLNKWEPSSLPLNLSHPKLIPSHHFKQQPNQQPIRRLRASQCFNSQKLPCNSNHQHRLDRV